MKNELNKKAIENGPEEHDGPKWPIELFGVECRSGWYQLIEPVVNYIDEYNKSHEDSRIIIEQIKEKWARLEIYVSYENVDNETIDIVNDMIDNASKESQKVCEDCGSRENVGMNLGGWYYIACEDCIKKFKENDFRNIRYWKRFSDGKKFKITPNEMIEWNGKFENKN